MLSFLRFVLREVSSCSIVWPIMDKSKTPEYRIWRQMLQRCYNPNHEGYRTQGARGIRVCTRWTVFDYFLEDVGKRPSKHHRLTRTDKTKGFDPTNARWTATKVRTKRLRGQFNGKFRSAEYNAWSVMMQSCYNTEHPQYKNYGGRSIRVSRRWFNFMNFLKDVGRKPTRKHMLTRINRDKDYKPGNVKWATRREVSNNRRTSKFITIGRVTKTLTEWARLKKIKMGAVASRRRRGMSTEDAIKTPARKHNTKYTYKGRTLLASEHAKIHGLPVKLVQVRLSRGYSIEQALTFPIQDSGRRFPKSDAKKTGGRFPK